MDDQIEIINIVGEFNKNIYLMENRTYMLLNTTIRFVGIGQVEIEKLNSTVSSIEVRKTIFDIGATKALGSDGFPALFCQINRWERIFISLSH